MPGTTHRVVDHQSLAERPTVMGATGADRENLLAAAGQQHGLLADPADQHGTGMPLVRSGWSRCSSQRNEGPATATRRAAANASPTIRDAVRDLRRYRRS
jgi:hypothetical protein